MAKTWFHLLTLLSVSVITQVQAQADPTGVVQVCLISGAPDNYPIDATQDVPSGYHAINTGVTAELQGMGVDITQVVFRQILNWNINVTYYKNFAPTLYRTRTDDGCDVAVSSLFVSARRDSCGDLCPNIDPAKPPVGEDFEPYACCLDFSHAYFSGGWALMSRINTGGTVDYINVIFQKDIVHAICVAVICTFFFAHLVWLIERTQFRKHAAYGDREFFEQKYLDGLRTGMWFASNALMNGVITSEKMIFTGLGRLVTTVWILFGILLLVFITSNISASLTTAKLNANQITTVDDLLDGKILCTEAGFFESFFTGVFPQYPKEKLHVVPNKGGCYDLVKNSVVDAAFGIREEFVAYFSEGQGLGLMISPSVYSQLYAIAWRERWPFASRVNEALLQFKEGTLATQPSYKDAVDKWYAGDAQQITYGGAAEETSKPWIWGLIGTAIALVGTYVLLQVFVTVGAYFASKEAADASAHGGNPEPLSPGKRSNSVNKSKSFVVAAARKLSGAVHPDPSAHNGSAYFGDRSVRNGAGSASNRRGSMSLGNVPEAALSAEIRDLQTKVLAMQRMLVTASSSSEEAPKPSPDAVVKF